MTYLSRRIGFSSAHRYYQRKFSDQKNREIFGRCFTEHGHGHNYTLEVTVSGAIDSDTGMVINLVDLDHVLKEVIDPLDHHHLNHDVEEFSEKVPTTENIVRHCFSEVKRRLPQNVKLVRARLYENEDLWADCLSQ